MRVVGCRPDAGQMDWSRDATADKANPQTTKDSALSQVGFEGRAVRPKKRCVGNSPAKFSPAVPSIGGPEIRNFEGCCWGQLIISNLGVLNEECRMWWLLLLL